MDIFDLLAKAKMASDLTEFDQTLIDIMWQAAKHSPEQFTAVITEYRKSVSEDKYKCGEDHTPHFMAALEVFEEAVVKLRPIVQPFKKCEHNRMVKVAN